MKTVGKIIDALIAVLNDAADGRIDGPSKRLVNRRLKALFLKARKQFWILINSIIGGRISSRSLALLILALTTAKALLLAVDVKEGAGTDGWDDDDEAELQELEPA